MLAPEVSDTQLDTESYMSAHYPTEQAYRNLYGDLARLLEHNAPPGDIGHALEIGSGSGAWTWGLSRDPRVKTLYASDISPGFLKRLHQTSANDDTLILQAGGEDLAFAQASLDLVLGRSVLHHIYDYRAVLSQIRTWLRPGGIAVFFEPNLQGKLWLAFYIEMIRRLNAALGPNDPAALGTASTRRLEGAMRHILKDFYHPDIDGIRPNIEDKYVFDINTLMQDGRDAGFANVDYVDQDQGNGLALIRIRNAVLPLLEADKAKTARFAPLFDAFEATFGLNAQTAPISPMGYFVFRA